MIRIFFLSKENVELAKPVPFRHGQFEGTVLILHTSPSDVTRSTMPSQTTRRADKRKRSTVSSPDTASTSTPPANGASAEDDTAEPANKKVKIVDAEVPVENEEEIPNPVQVQVNEFDETRKVVLSDMEDAIADGLTCSICTAILCECVSIWPCLHSFCGGCLTQWAHDGRKDVSLIIQEITFTFCFS